MNSFGRDKRLLDAESFQRVFQKNRRSADDLFLVLAHRVRGRSGARLGLAIAKKNLKRACDRNLVKRIVRESFRHHQMQLEGLDIVVLVRSRIDLKDRKALHYSLQNHWKRVSSI